MSNKNLLSFLTEESLRESCCGKVFDRGYGYFRQDLPEILHCDDNEVQAEIEGSDIYHVSITLHGEHFAASCDCPAMDQFPGICKHIVATGLKTIAESGKTEISRKKKKSRPTQREKIETYLESLEAADLHAMLMDFVMKDKALRQSVLRQVEKRAVQGKGGESLFKMFKAQITAATRTGRFVDYHETDSWFAPLFELLGDIKKDILPSNPDAAVDLCEYLYERLVGSIENIDDSDGQCGMLLYELDPLLYEAYASAKMEPEKLAENIYTMRRENWLFSPDMEEYTALLGEKGLRHLSALVRGAFEKESCREQGKDTDKDYTLERMMAEVLHREGTLDEKIAFMARDLNWPRDYIKIAELCEREGDTDKAVQWLDKGLGASFGAGGTQEIPWVRASFHIRRQEYQAAQDLLWKTFEGRLDYESWCTLKQMWEQIDNDAQRCSPATLEKRAVETLETGLSKSTKQSKSSRYEYYDPLSSMRGALIKIHLDGNRPQYAWKTAKGHKVSDARLCDIADAIKEGDPAVAVEIYKTQVENLIEQTNNGAYKQAVKLIESVKPLVPESEFRPYLTGLKDRFKRKRNFIKILGGI